MPPAMTRAEWEEALRRAENANRFVFDAILRSLSAYIEALPLAKHSPFSAPRRAKGPDVGL